MSRDIELQESRPALDVEIYPGTEIMADYAGSHLTHGGNKSDGTVLVPQPSHLPDDPLNWSPFWKWTIVAVQAFFILTSVISALSVSPLTPVFEAQFKKDASAIALLTSSLVLVTGYTNFILVPVAEVYGRRFVLIVCGLITFAASLWQGAAQSYGSFMGARVLVAVGMSIGESLMPMVIGDVFFLHERGRFVSIYFFCLFNGMFLGPLIAGVCDQHFSTWRVFYWIMSSFEGLSCLTIIFLHPETKYKRNLADIANDPTQPRAPEKSPFKSGEVPDTSVVHSEQALDIDQSLGRGKPTKRQFRLIQPVDRDAISTLSRHIITPFQLLGFPIVLFGSWMLAFSANGLLVLNYIQSGALIVPPYNFNNAQVGYTNLALVCGGTLGMVTAGPMSDWVAMYLTKKNRGIREPEMRLYSVIPFVIISAISLVVVGVGFDHKWPWEAVIIVGFGGVGLMTVSVSTIGITYAVDSYKPVAGQIMVIATVLKNSFGFGMGYYLTEWVESSGYTPALTTAMALITGPALLGVVVFTIYGKRFRKLTRNSKVHSFEL